MLDLEKIQNTIAGEVNKAVNANRKATIKLVKEYVSNLIDAINDLDSDEVEEATAAEKPAKPKLVKEEKPAKAAKKDKIKDEEDTKPAKAKVEDEDGDEDGGYDFSQDDIDEVDDEEIGESDYVDLSVAKLKAEIKKRGINVPPTWGKDELAKVLILDDEENEDEDE